MHSLVGTNSHIYNDIWEKPLYKDRLKVVKGYSSVEFSFIIGFQPYLDYSIKIISKIHN